MNTRLQLLCAWCGPLCAIGWVLGFWTFAGFIPPPEPGADAETIAALYRENTFGIRFGLMILMFAGSFYGAWSAVITVQMKRIEGVNPVMAYTQLVMGAVFVLIFVIPVTVWQAAAFRPEGSPELIQRLNDLGWIMFLNPVSTILVQGLAIGAAILADKSSKPIFPRWAGYFSIWCVLIFQPGALLVFFKSGPFAWNGLLAWWIPLGVFTAWMLTMSGLLIGAIKREAASAA